MVSENVLKDRITDRRTQALALGILEGGIYGLSLERALCNILSSSSSIIKDEPLLEEATVLVDSASMRAP